MTEWLYTITVGDVMSAFIVCVVLYRVLPMFLPDAIAGPGGWLVNTDEAD